MEAVAAAEFHQPDLVLLDILMPGLDGIEAARRIAERVPETVIVDAHRGAR